MFQVIYHCWLNSLWLGCQLVHKTWNWIYHRQKTLRTTSTNAERHTSLRLLGGTRLSLYSGCDTAGISMTTSVKIISM